MAKTETTTPDAQPTTAAVPLTAMSALAPAIGWLIPGAGHLIQKRWVRGLLLMLSIGAMFILGLMMNGRIYKPNGGDILDMLGFVGDVGAGGLYIVARAMELGGGPA